MHIHFVESSGAWQKLLPLTYTRPITDLRVGILTISEKWGKRLGGSSVSFKTEGYLQNLFPSEKSNESLSINANLLPNQDLIKTIQNLKTNQELWNAETFLASKGDALEKIEFSGEVNLIEYPWDIFRLNKQEIEADYDLLTEGRTSQPITDQHTKTYGNRIFLEEGVQTKAAILNSEEGAIYLGKNSRVHEGAIIRGSFALGEEAHVNLGAKIKGDTTVGPFCKVGGEVSNSVFYAHSSKGHDGFLGNSVIGEWCNLGADTNNSNLKNNYANVKMWDFESEGFKDTGLQFCGLIMGDHSKCGINTMFNTGTTVGVSANIYGTGFSRTIIPSFAWGGANGFNTYLMKKAFETAELVMQRRNKSLTEEDKEVLTHIFEKTSQQRVWGANK
ncbi:MAG: glucose-1-phosphate thymidylyltransferase [Cytophagales bacterium]|nr:glucose-1-phosphate thymidylyltransferase [Cytophagales bacterium]